MEADSVLCEVWNKSLFVTQILLTLKKIKSVFPQYLDFRKTQQGKFITLTYVRNNVRNCSLLSVGGGTKRVRGVGCYKKKSVPLM